MPRTRAPIVPKRLPAGDGPKLLALARTAGLRGLRESEASVVLGPDYDNLLAVAEKLEERGEIRILSFEPLFLVAREAVDFFSQRVLAFAARFHASHPKDKGLTLDRVQTRFDFPRKVLLFGLKSLVREGKLREEGEFYALPDFRPTLAPREEMLLAKLEEMCFAGDVRTVSVTEMRDTLKLSPQALDRLIEVLVDRKRILRDKDGFFVHQKWLDEVVAKVRGLGKREMSVPEFKALTGLSRKYAIPLLELLDEMGVTRRRGSVRDIT